MLITKISASRKGDYFENKNAIETKLVGSELIKYPSSDVGFKILSDLFASNFFDGKYRISDILLKGITGKEMDVVEKLIFVYLNRTPHVKNLRLSIGGQIDNQGQQKTSEGQVKKRGRPKKSFSFYSAKEVLDNASEIDSIKSQLLNALSEILDADNDYGINIGEELLSKLPKNEKINIYDKDGKIKPEYKKPATDNVVPEDYYKTGNLANIYYPYAFRSGPDNPSVNHDITKYDNVFKAGFDLFERFVDGVLRDYEKLGSEDIAISESDVFKRTGIIEKLAEIFKDAEKAGKFVCDVRVLSCFDFMPTFLIYKEGAEKSAIFTINSVVCGFLSNEAGVSAIFEGEGLQSVKENNVKSIFYDSSFYHKKGYFNQYLAIKKSICVDDLSAFYDELSDFLHENYLKEYEKYSTIHSLFVANIFALLLFMDSSAFGESALLQAPIYKVNADIKYIDNMMSIENFSIILDKSNKIESYSQDVLLDFDFPIVSIFADTSEFDYLVENAFCVVSKRDSSASVDDIHNDNMFSDDIEVR